MTTVEQPEDDRPDVDCGDCPNGTHRFGHHWSDDVWAREARHAHLRLARGANLNPVHREALRREGA